jgi:hypothetical protein
MLMMLLIVLWKLNHSQAKCVLLLSLFFFLASLLLFDSINGAVIERGLHNNRGQQKMVSDPVTR